MAHTKTPVGPESYLGKYSGPKRGRAKRKAASKKRLKEFLITSGMTDVIPSLFSEGGLDGYHEVGFQGRKLIVASGYNESDIPYVIVPGYKASKIYPKRGISAVRVKPVPEKDQERVEKFLKKKFQGSINFW